MDKAASRIRLRLSIGKNRLVIRGGIMQISNIQLIMQN